MFLFRTSQFVCRQSNGEEGMSEGKLASKIGLDDEKMPRNRRYSIPFRQSGADLNESQMRIQIQKSPNGSHVRF